MSLNLCRCKVIHSLSRRGKIEILHSSKRGAFFWQKKDKDSEINTAVVDELMEIPRKYKPGEDGHLITERLNSLQSKRLLTTRKGYSPPHNVEDIVQRVVSESSKVGDTHWTQVSLSEPKTKFKILTKLIEEFNHDIPNVTMNSISTVQDAVDFFKTEISEATRYEDFSQLNLPQNLHIQLEPNRFNPETDTMFGGRTAFPGQDTRVTSIKYRRKYDSIKTTKEKAGYENHYYGY